MHPRWHEVVARALGCGARKHGGLNINKAMRIKVAAHGHGNLVTQHKIALHKRAAQIEHAMGKPCRLRKMLVIELKRRRHRGVKKLKLKAENLNLATGHIGIHGTLGTLTHPARYTQAELIAQGLGQLKHRLAVGVTDNLCKALAVSKVDENYAPMISSTMHPAAERHSLIKLACGKLSAVMTSHKNIL